VITIIDAVRPDGIVSSGALLRSLSTKTTITATRTRTGVCAVNEGNEDAEGEHRDDANQEGDEK
jgi:hypothetical protein